jgi:hypothetical protein
MTVKAQSGKDERGSIPIVRGGRGMCPKLVFSAVQFRGFSRIPKVQDLSPG